MSRSKKNDDASWRDRRFMCAKTHRKLLIVWDLLGLFAIIALGSLRRAVKLARGRSTDRSSSKATHVRHLIELLGFLFGHLFLLGRTSTSAQTGLLPHWVEQDKFKQRIALFCAHLVQLNLTIRFQLY